MIEITVHWEIFEGFFQKVKHFLKIRVNKTATYICSYLCGYMYIFSTKYLKLFSWKLCFNISHYTVINFNLKMCTSWSDQISLEPMVLLY